MSEKNKNYPIKEERTILEKLRDNKEEIAAAMAVVALGAVLVKGGQSIMELREEQREDRIVVADANRVGGEYLGELSPSEKVMERTLFRDAEGNWNIEDQGVAGAALGYSVGYAVVSRIRNARRRNEELAAMEAAEIEENEPEQ